MPELISPIAQRKSVIGRHDLPILADRAEDHEMGTGALRTDFRYFRRTEAAREGELGLIVHLLTAKDENRMFLKSPAHRRIGGAIRCNLRNLHAAQLHGEPWTQRYDIHRHHSPPFSCSTFPQIQLAGKQPKSETRNWFALGQKQASVSMAP